MAKWRNFFLQKSGVTGGSPYPTYESVSQWGVWCKEIPFKIYDKVKAPAKRTWFDEHGDDEYVPDSGLFMEAYTMKVTFGCKKMSQTSDGGTTIGGVEDVRVKVGAFLDYLRTSGMMMMYSSYTRIGRKDVRLEAIDDNAKWESDIEDASSQSSSSSSEEEGTEFLIFEVTFKVNDPVTDVSMINGSLVIDSSSSSTV